MEGWKDRKSLVSWTAIFILLILAYMIVSIQGPGSYPYVWSEGELAGKTFGTFLVLLLGYWMGAKIVDDYVKRKGINESEKWKKIVKNFKIAFWILIIIWILASFLFFG